MLDGVPFNDGMAAALRKLTGVNDRPVLQIASPSHFWNMWGSGVSPLVAARPGKFIGVLINGASHVDALEGSNPVIQFGAQLLIGFSKPINPPAFEALSVGWINDMYSGQHTQGVYAAPGQEITVGDATGYALPEPPTLWAPLDAVAQNVTVLGLQAIFVLLDLQALADGLADLVA
jgi:hypothetical protein